MPIWEGRISPVLDVAGRFLVVQIKNGHETNRREISVAETNPTLLVKGIQEMGIEVLLCGALSEPVAFLLAKSGVRVWPHLCGEAESVLRAFLADKLGQAEFRMPGCCLGHCFCRRNRYRRRSNLRRNNNEESIKKL
jgi:predicted Fe-Mo cluster-binding NifX family protein